MSILRRTDPYVIVLLASPVILCFFPDGIPFAMAGCTGTAAGEPVAGLTCDGLDACEVDCGGKNAAVTYACEATLSGDPDECKYNASVKIEIFASDCVVNWEGRCGTVCYTTQALKGATSAPTTVNKLHWCDAVGDAMRLSLITAPGSCLGCNGMIFDSTGQCGD